MLYVSTRGAAPALDFEEVLLAGLAADGGLYLPAEWPAFSARDLIDLRGLSYPQAAARIMAPFLGDAFTPAELAELTQRAYAPFAHPATAPLVQMGPNDWLLDLTRGPTLAFKDYALQFLGLLFDAVLARRGERLTILGATSGDTGSAAIAACRGRANLDLFILYPEGRVSEVQRRQMTTEPAANVQAIAVKGTFDDCQDLVKALFGDRSFREEARLSAVNSINWARVMAQIVYYVTSAVALGAPDRAVAFAVPSGNFGNVFAGYAAARMGLPVARLIVGSNRNDILARFFETGTMALGQVHPTLSPSMDIQVSSNFERLLFELHGRDGAQVGTLIQQLRRETRFSVDRGVLDRARALFAGARFEDEETVGAIRHAFERTGIVVDPHTAVGLLAAQACRPAPEIPVVSLATAHPAKFPDAVQRAIGRRPELPPQLADLMSRKERITVLANDVEAVRGFIRSHRRESGR